jgi:hypothetical protein
MYGDVSFQISIRKLGRPGGALLFAFAILSIAAPTAQADTLEWTRQFGTNTWDVGYAVSADAFGNIYTSGTTGSAIDVIIAKYNDAGMLQWSRQFGTGTSDYGSNIWADYVGNVYISGSTRDSLFGPHAGEADAFLRKYDALGDPIWSKQFGTSGPEECLGVASDTFGNVYVSGLTEGALAGSYMGRNDAFIIKYNANGDLQWSRQLGTSDYDWSSGISADSLGNLYISGTTFGDLSGANAGLADAFVAKYDPAGNRLWLRQFGTIYYDYAHDTSVDDLGNVYVAGQGYANSNNAYLAKYDTDGNFKWRKQLVTTKHEIGYDVSVDGLGNVYLVGTTEGNLSGTNAGGFDAFVAKYDAAGNVLWLEQFGTPYDDTGYGISADGLGNIYIAGETEGSLGAPNLGDSDIFLRRYSGTPATPHGDYNGDSAVDGADYVWWRNNDGTPAGYNTWRANFGTAAAAGSSNGKTAPASRIPEPTSILIGVIGTVVIVVLGRRDISNRPRSNTTYGANYASENL